MAVVVVLALTGFSTGRGGRGSSGGHSGGGGGGGCSSSRQDHDSSSSSSGGYRDYDYDDDFDGSGSNDDGYDDPYGDSPTDGSSASAEDVEPATVKLVKCATVKEPCATVEVTNPNAVYAEFWVAVSFKDRSGRTIKDETWRVDVPADDKVTVDIEMARKSKAASLDHCEVEPKAELYTP